MSRISGCESGIWATDRGMRAVRQTRTNRSSGLPAYVVVDMVSQEATVVRLPEGSPKVNELKMGGVKVETFAVAEAPVEGEVPAEETPVEGEEAPVEEGEAEQTPAEEGEAEAEGEVVTEPEEAAE